MKIAIIGAGFTGLSAGYRLSKKGHEVTVIEKDNFPGGLAVGYQEDKWEWSVEKHYHHWFTNDYSVLNLAKEINHKVYTIIPETNWFVKGKIYKFVSLKAALTFPLLTPLERIRQLLVLGLLRLNPFWQILERYETNKAIPKLMGKKIYSLLWESILKNKFGKYADDISLAWFWARIKKRTIALSYPEGGFLSFADHLVKEIEKNGGKVLFNREIVSLLENKDKSIAITSNSKKETFDRVIVTLPSFLFLKIAPQLPDEYKKKLIKLKGLGATNLVLRLNKPFFSDNTYWLSVADITSPIMAIVEHTNFMDKIHYNNEHLVYLGNYLGADEKKFLMDKEQLLKLFDPFLRKINPEYHENLIGYELFKAPFAQPIIPTNYSKFIPPFTTPFNNVYLANIEQVYPWDRGTNYAVELGEKIAKII